ncbi:MAG: cation transporter [Gloeomargarita sp. SKYBB_i_bin120]|nr:cation transporter [Gloeomargarita sp. SKYG98]MCS7292941.1 cation transporter [Gloeomargarita sp. SKYB120]MDW8178506.1 cation transporter [Gloeomargarita sp. SKYBB_i_bin120]
MPTPNGAELRRTVLTVALLNFAYFTVEAGIAVTIGSVSLWADSIDFLEDTLLNALVYRALGWRRRYQTWVSLGLAGLLLMPALATLGSLWRKLQAPLPPEPVPLSLAGLGALAVNWLCALLLLRFRHQGSSLALAAFFSARNDALANLAIILAGLLTAAYPSPWPDVVVGVGIFALNTDAAWKVYRQARAEQQT